MEDISNICIWHVKTDVFFLFIKFQVSYFHNLIISTRSLDVRFPPAASLQDREEAWGEPLRTFLESTGDPEHNPHSPGGADPG